MTKTLSWHSTLSTDRPLYHDDTRCPDGATIALKDRRPGDGGRDPCEHCAGLLIQALEARLLPPGSDRPSGSAPSSTCVRIAPSTPSAAPAAS